MGSIPWTIAILIASSLWLNLNRLCAGLIKLVPRRPLWKQKMSPGRIKIRVIKTVKRQYVSPKIDCRLHDKCPAEKSFLSERGHTCEREKERARADALTRSRMDWRTRSSLHRRMIELYLKHRDRLINILEMIDGKERCVCAYLSKIVQRKQRAAATRAVRAGERANARAHQKESHWPLVASRGFREGMEKKALGRSRRMTFFFLFFFWRASTSAAKLFMAVESPFCNE